MSDKNQNKGQKPENAAEEKIVTRYERKLQRRQEEKKKEERAKKRDLAIGILILVVLVCVVASFPIRTWLAVNETYVEIGGDNVTKVEFDYNYNLAVNNYISQYGSMLSYFGLDTSADFSTQMYTETLTWKDFFDQMTVDNIIRSKALVQEAEANGFTYDTTEDYAEYEESVKTAAGEQGVSVSDFLRAGYGSYATMNRLAPYVKEAMIANAYYDEIADSREPADEEVQAYYDENTNNYDSVDYRMITVNAELPTEPTELADPVEETEASTAENSENTEAAEEAAYEPSEAEIAKAMEDALVLAEEAESTVAEAGELQENVKMSSISSSMGEWLFDSSRKAGDTTIITNDTAHAYYVLAFEQRYLDETASADVRVILMTETEELTGQSVLDEWTNGAATEESFIELVKKYTEDTASAEEGGLFEAVVPTGMDEAMGAWLFDEARTTGDTTAVASSDGYTYVMYYVGANEPEWKLTIRSTLLSQTMTEYMQGIMEGVEVEDSKGNLNYLKIQAMEEAIAASESAAETGTEETETEETGTETAGTEDAETQTTVTGE